MKANQILLAILISLPILVAGQSNYVLDTNGLNDIYEGGSTEFELADIDDDGDLDMISVGDHMSPLYANEKGVMVFRNTPNGWLKDMYGNFGYGGVAVGDVNNDGFLDIGYGVHHDYGSMVIPDLGDQKLEVVLGNGLGYSWIPWDNNLAMQGQSWGMFDCDFADIDNDGLLDLGANSFGSPDGVWIYKNLGNGYWDVFGGALGGNSNRSIAFGDFDNDGYVDFIANHEKYNNVIGNIWKGDGSGNFSPMSTGFYGGYSFDFALGEFTSDGAMDIVVTHGGRLKPISFDTITQSWILKNSGIVGSGFYNVAIGDMNQDGHKDIVGTKSGRIVIFAGNGQGSWTAIDSIDMPVSSFRDIKVGDLDHNGFPDIAFWGTINGANMVRVYMHNGTQNQLDITPEYPKGGEIICGNSAQTIQWKRSVPANLPYSVRLDYSVDGKNGNYLPIDSNITRSNSYQWVMPKISSTNIYLRMIISSGNQHDTAYTDTAFTIKPCVIKPIWEDSLNATPSFCQVGDTLNLAIDSAYGAIGYFWDFPQGWMATANGTTAEVIPNTASGSVLVYAYTAKDTSNAATIQISKVNIDTTINFTNGQLSVAEPLPATYQWWNCDINQPVSNATSQSFLPNISGNYQVEVFKEGCSLKSSCREFILNIHEIASNKTIQIQPNPTTDIITVSSDETMEQIQVFDSKGKLCKEYTLKQRTTKLNLTEFPSGIYYLNIITDNQAIKKQIIKN